MDLWRKATKRQGKRGTRTVLAMLSLSPDMIAYSSKVARISSAALSKSGTTSAVSSAKALRTCAGVGQPQEQRGGARGGIPVGHRTPGRIRQ
eukprot:8109076-Heterocapsa_arctica.AAC.1